MQLDIRTCVYRSVGHKQLCCFRCILVVYEWNVSVDKHYTGLLDPNIPWEASPGFAEQNFVSLQFK